MYVPSATIFRRRTDCRASLLELDVGLVRTSTVASVPSSPSAHSLNSRDRYNRVSRWAPKTSQSIEISRVVEVQMMDMEHTTPKHGDTWP
jgi:hypothetical protein